MKKILTMAVILAMALTFASCKKEAPAATNERGEPVAASSGNKPSAEQISYKVDGEYLVFTVSNTLRLEIDSWIGICTKGNYVFEDDADDAGITYTYFEERENETQDYVFKLGFSDIEDGDYTMVLCNTDNNGYVMASWPLVIKGGKPAADLSGFKINPMPENMPPPEEPVTPDDGKDVEDGEDDYYEDDPQTGDDDSADDGYDDDEEPDDGADDA